MKKCLDLVGIFIKNIKKNGLILTSKKIYIRSLNFLSFKIDSISSKNSTNCLLAKIQNYEVNDDKIPDYKIISDKKIAIHLHLFYIDMIDYFIDKFLNIETSFDIYISIPSTLTSDRNEVKKRFLSSLPYLNYIEIAEVENRGRDIAPLIITFGSILLKYDFICHVHSKKSSHTDYGDFWRDNIIYLLLGSKKVINQNLHFLSDGASVIFPEENKTIIMRNGGWCDNYIIGKKLLRKYFNKSIKNYNTIVFPQGSMFWARSEAIREFLTLPLCYNDFKKEPLPHDGTIAHALERLILVSSNQDVNRYIRLYKNPKSL